MERWLIWVDRDHACFGLVVDDRQKVVRAPPIARYTRGWDAGRAKRYFRRTGARVKVYGCSSAES